MLSYLPRTLPVPDERGSSLASLNGRSVVYCRACLDQPIADAELTHTSL